MQSSSRTERSAMTKASKKGPIDAEAPVGDAVFEKFCTALDARVRACSMAATAPFLTIIDAAIQAHDDAMALVSQESEPGDTDTGQRVAYVEATLAGVLEPVLDVIRSANPANRLTSAPASDSNEFDRIYYRLSRDAQTDVHPVRAVLESMAPILNKFEAAVWHWTGEALAAITDEAKQPNKSAASLPDGGIEDKPPAQEPPGVSSDVLRAAANLSASLHETRERFGSLCDANVAAARIAAKSHTRSILKGGATSQEAATAAEEQIDKVELSDWKRWYRVADQRVLLCIERVRLCLEAAAGESDLEAVLNAAVGKPMEASYAAVSAKLTELNLKVHEIFRQLAQLRDGRQAIRGLFEVLDEAMLILDQELYSSGYASRAIDRIAASAAAARRRISERTSALDDTLELHALPASSTEAPVRTSGIRVRTGLREAAQSAYLRWLDPALTLFVRTTTDRLNAAEKQEQGLSAVLRFHLGAAIEELREVSWVRDADTKLSSATAAAQELAGAGFDRSVEGLREFGLVFEAAAASEWQTVIDSRRRFQTSVEAFVSAETGRSRITQKTSHSIVRLSIAGRQVFSPAIRRLRRNATLLALRLARSIKNVITFSRSAVIGVNNATDYQGTIDALSGISPTRSALPLVYRRLFSFHPLNDETLFAGRQSDIAWLTNRLKAWNQGRASATVLTGAPGCGLTTIINVARRTAMRGCRFHILELTDRFQNESKLVSRLRTTLRLAGDDTGNSDTLEALSTQILNQEPSDTVPVCIIEHLEALLIRTVSGNELLARTLRFLSETDTRVLWIATTSGFSWQLMEKLVPASTGLVTHYQMSEYNRPTLEPIIMQRHDRSGLPIVFDPPARKSSLLRRRLHQANSAGETQLILREAFFDDLFAVCGQNVMLAIFYWLLAVRHEDDPSRIRVCALPRLNFDFIGRLDWPQLFALKALLEHGSLTPEELSAIECAPVESSLEILEALGNALAIEALSSEEITNFEPNFERVERAARYRIRPLMVQPIVRVLRGKNIIH